MAVCRFNFDRIDFVIDFKDKIYLIRPEVAILVIGMPPMSGYEVALSLRREQWGYCRRRHSYAYSTQVTYRQTLTASPRPR